MAATWNTGDRLRIMSGTLAGFEVNAGYYYAPHPAGGMMHMYRFYLRATFHEVPEYDVEIVGPLLSENYWRGIERLAAVQRPVDAEPRYLQPDPLLCAAALRVAKENKRLQRERVKAARQRQLPPAPLKTRPLDMGGPRDVWISDTAEEALSRLQVTWSAPADVGDWVINSDGATVPA